MHHLLEMSNQLKEHILKLHFGKCQKFQAQVKYLGHMIYLGGLGVQKVKVETISHNL